MFILILLQINNSEILKYKSNKYLCKKQFYFILGVLIYFFYKSFKIFLLKRPLSITCFYIFCYTLSY